MPISAGAASTPSIRAATASGSNADPDSCSSRASSFRSGSRSIAVITIPHSRLARAGAFHAWLDCDDAAGLYAAQQQILCSAAKACAGVPAMSSHQLHSFRRKIVFRVAAPGSGLCPADGARRPLARRYWHSSLANWGPDRGCPDAGIVLAAARIFDARPVRPPEGGLSGLSAEPASGKRACALVPDAGRRITRVDHPSMTIRRSRTMPQPRCGASTIGS